MRLIVHDVGTVLHVGQLYRSPYSPVDIHRPSLGGVSARCHLCISMHIYSNRQLSIPVDVGTHWYLLTHANRSISMVAYRLFDLPVSSTHFYPFRLCPSSPPLPCTRLYPPRLPLLPLYRPILTSTLLSPSPLFSLYWPILTSTLLFPSPPLSPLPAYTCLDSLVPPSRVLMQLSGGQRLYDVRRESAPYTTGDLKYVVVSRSKLFNMDTYQIGAF